MFTTKIGMKAIGIIEKALNDFVAVSKLTPNSKTKATASIIVIDFTFFSLLSNSSLVYSVTGLFFKFEFFTDLIFR